MVNHYGVHEQDITEEDIVRAYFKCLCERIAKTLIAYRKEKKENVDNKESDKTIPL